MRKTATLLALVTALCGGAHAGDDHKPMHGGVMSHTRDVDLELVAKPDVMQLYLSDHGKKMDHAKASARLTLLSGKDKQEVTLIPAGDKLEARGAFRLGAGTKAIAVVSRDGKPVGTARFELK